MRDRVHGWRWGVGAVLAVLVALGSGVGASAATGIDPGTGSAAGGTQVTLPDPTGGAKFTAVSASSSHSLALGSDGKAYAWGYNNYGQLGNGTTTSSSVPLAVTMPPGVTFTSVKAGSLYSTALGSDGKAYAWGYNNYGQLGNGTITSSSVPVAVTLPAGVTFTSVNLAAGGSHSLALGSDGKTYAWGANNYGQLGIGTTTNSTIPVPVTMPVGVTFTSVNLGFSYSVALGSDGKAYAWGYNANGQLGNGTTTNSSVPLAVAMPAGPTFTSISAGGSHTLALDTDGNAYAWGYNAYGRLGNGTTTNSSVPVAVTMPAEATFTSIHAGDYYSLALGSDGKAYAWGLNANGQLGNGTTTNSSVPVAVTMPPGVTFTNIDAGSTHSLALGSDGKAYAWGLNNYGQLGIGTNTNSSVPVVVTNSVTVTSVAFGGTVGTGLVQNPDRTWSVTTPAHGAGAVDVVVSWTWNGVAQAPITYTDGFTFEPVAVAPTVTDPSDQTVVDGANASFEVSVTGTPAPAVVWQVSRDSGATWEAVTVDPDATVSSDGLTVTVKGSEANGGFLYRATASNSAGSATSAAARLTVSKTPPIPVAPKITNPKDQAVKDGAVAEFSVEVTGTPEPTVKWQLSRDGGKTWQAVSADPTAKLSNGGLTLTVAGSEANDGFLYRATASNSAGSATSEAAKLAVTQEGGGGTPKPGTPGGTKTDGSLALTGGGSEQGLLGLSLAALVLGGGLVVTNRVLKRRQNH
ncbi:hypothetical protein [Leifsonia aquatica]|uniref:RCC1 domain-containing protein n=1 Tax=Leifsonia aquatica TaxID=144185 RepID=UPI0009E0AC65|nr:hypothetical protein [Leifsonia aquatica]